MFDNEKEGGKRNKRKRVKRMYRASLMGTISIDVVIICGNTGGTFPHHCSTGLGRCVEGMGAKYVVANFSNSESDSFPINNRN